MRPTLLLFTLLLAACSATTSTGTAGYSPSAPDTRPPSSTSERSGQRTASAEALTPYSSTMVYPANWPEITRRRQ
jgi:hypothetical protein